MSKLLNINTAIVTICVVIFVAFFGCSIAQDAFTPCPIDPAAAEYADEPLMDHLPFSTLFDAKKINNKMNYMHDGIQTELVRKIEDDNRLYSFLKDTHASNIQAGYQAQEMLFSPTGLGALIPGLSGLGIGTFMLSKPKDKKKIVELEKKVNGNG